MNSDSPTKKNKGGRPTTYKPEYCQMLIDHMRLGLSYEAFAGVPEVHCAVDTLYKWEKNNEEFAEAKKVAFAACRLFWEKTGLAGLWDETEYENGKPSFKRSLNTGVWIFNMKNRFSWTDRREIEVVDQKSKEHKEFIEAFKKALDANSNERK